jgi:hypothetical protein
MHAIKLKRAAKLSHLSRYPRTWSAIISRIPAGALASLTGAQIAQIADALHAQYERGHSAGFADAQ